MRTAALHFCVYSVKEYHMAARLDIENIHVYNLRRLVQVVQLAFRRLSTRQKLGQQANCCWIHSKYVSLYVQGNAGWKAKTKMSSTQHPKTPLPSLALVVSLGQLH